MYTGSKRDRSNLGVLQFFCMGEKKNEFFKNILAGLTVSFVALSLGAAFGLLSGRGAFAGMISAAIIATITSLFGGTRIQCSGPTGPMTAVTAVVVAASHDVFKISFPDVPADHFINITLLLGGGLLVLFAVLRLGKFISYIPNVVVSGFMNGIAVIIWLDQLRRMFGFGGKEAFLGPFWQNLLLVFLSAGVVFLFPYATRRFMPRYASLLSATFISIIAVSAFAHFFHFDVEHVQLTQALGSFGDLAALVVSQIPTHWSWGIIAMALPFALQLAVLGYLDTLMTALVIDKMTKEKTYQNKELAAQGIANGAAALFGGIPGAQATIRSVLLVKEKATLRLAGVLVGVFAFIEMFLFQDLINLIPQAVFAGVLMKVGYDVFDWQPLRLYFKELTREPLKLLHNFFSRHDDEPIYVTNREMMIILGTAVITVLWNLNASVAFFTALFYAHNFVFNKQNPMRDLTPVLETEPFGDEV